MRLLEVRNGIDKPGELDHSTDLVETAEGTIQASQNIDRAKTGGLLALFYGELAALLANEFKLFLCLGNLAGDEDQAPGYHGGDLVGRRHRHGRQLYSQVFQSFFDFGAHWAPLHGQLIEDYLIGAMSTEKVRSVKDIDATLPACFETHLSVT